MFRLLVAVINRRENSFNSGPHYELLSDNVNIFGVLSDAYGGKLRKTK
ncbi:hypothetical protein GS682_28000 [Nostoc sp. B(2019)]|nr:hypothetical protein [Nostoc sp. B(2019)]